MAVGVALNWVDSSVYGVQVHEPTRDMWLVGVWEYDTIGGTITNLADRMSWRHQDGEADWLPTSVYLLSRGELVKCEVQYAHRGHTQVFITGPASLGSPLMAAQWTKPEA